MLQETRNIVVIPHTRLTQKIFAGTGRSALPKCPCSRSCEIYATARHHNRKENVYCTTSSARALLAPVTRWLGAPSMRLLDHLGLVTVGVLRPAGAAAQLPGEDRSRDAVAG